MFIHLQKFIFLSIFACIVLVSCDKSADPGERHFVDCNFVQNDDDVDGKIDEIERALMNDCIENELTSKAEIEDNLIGGWELVGHGEGWVHTVSQPCAQMIISQDSITLEFENTFTDTIAFHSWEIIKNASGNHYLSTEPSLLLFTTMNVFCDNYMYGDGTPYDGNMYLFEKKE